MAARLLLLSLLADVLPDSVGASMKTSDFEYFNVTKYNK